jgi:hypothetical protein
MLFEDTRFSQLLKDTHKGFLKYLFTRHFQIGARFSKYVKEAKSFEWNKTFLNSLFP